MIENERIKNVCQHCGKDIYLTFNTKECPKCGAKYDEEEVKNIFYKLESARANSALYQFGEKLEKAGKGLEDAGNSMNSTANSMIGCGCFILLGLLAMVFLLLFL